MRVVFADTFYYLALLNPRDPGHAEAVAASGKLVGRLVTTSFVLTEVADALAAPRDRPRFRALMEALEGDASVTIVPASDELFRRGVQLYHQRPDKDWPLTDCISFVVMNDCGATEALTGDRHFQQAGFTVLLAGA